MIRFFNRFDIKKHGFAICGLFLCVYFTFHLLQGPRSIFYLQSLTAENLKLEKALTDEKAERQKLEQRVVMLRPGSLDRDLLEERARVMLGYVSPDEIMIPE